VTFLGACHDTIRCEQSLRRKPAAGNKAPGFSALPKQHRNGKLKLNPFDALVIPDLAAFPVRDMMNDFGRWLRWWEERAAPPLISERRCPDGGLDGASERHYLDGALPVCFIIDDDDAHRHFMSLVLQGHGIETGVFADAEALRQGLARRKPDLVFLNVTPVTSHAITAVGALVDHAFNGSLQLMGASGATEVETISRLGRTHGMNVLPALTKPLDRALIKRVIRANKLDVPVSHSERIGLDVALREGWVEFWYQPKIDLRRKQLAGVELFARVRHPEHGILSPSTFLDGADDKSLMALLEKSIIDAMKTGGKCAKLGISLKLAINVSITALMKLPLPGIVREHRPKTANWPGLILDLTEDQIASDLKLVREVVAELQPSGIEFAIDDFGRGYLPMARLQELPRFSELKLDRGFVAGCAADKGHAAICKTVIDLAHNFGSSAVAVGVEDPADANALTKMDCDIAQGYLFAQPMAVDRFQALLRQRAEQTKAAERARKEDGDGKSDRPGRVRGTDLVSVSRGPCV
jgi:EAL domain-containing protein (putative c-di-GMP-specific phosphodiesterase class I)